MSWLAPIPSLSNNTTSSDTTTNSQSSQTGPPQSLDHARRIHQVTRLKPEHYEAYKKCHAEVWPEVLEQIRRSNIVDYSISYDPQSSLLFASYKYTGKDFDADMAATRAHEPTRKWWAMTDGYQESVNPGAVSSEVGGTVQKDGKKVPGWWKDVEEVFYLP